VAEWFKAPVLKTGRGFTLPRGFESHPFRHPIPFDTRQAGKQQEAKALEDIRLAKERRERPLVEQYPALTAAPYIGGAAAGWASYVPRARAVGLFNQYAERAADAVRKAEAALQKSPAPRKRSSASSLEL
jgi:hypothetical protein